MSDDEPPARKLKVDAYKRRFFQTKYGQTIACYPEHNWVVSDLLDDVVERCANLKTHRAELTLYKSKEEASSETGQALDPWDDFSVLGESGKYGGNPLFVDYPDALVAPSGGGDLAPVLESLARIETKVQPIVNVAFAIGPAKSEFSFGYKARVSDHYDIADCILLRSLINSWPGWELHGDLTWCVVGEHIFPKDAKYVALARELEIDVKDVRNGLPLLKDIEEMYGNGHMQLLPWGDTGDGGVCLKVFVAKEFWWQPLKEGFETDQGRNFVWAFKGDQWHRISYGDMHELEVHLTPRPFMRSLFMKARMAFQQHPELTNPESMLQAFADGCAKFELFQRLFASHA